MFMDFFIRWRRGFLLSYNYFINIYIYSSEFLRSVNKSPTSLYINKNPKNPTSLLSLSLKNVSNKRTSKRTTTDHPSTSEVSSLQYCTQHPGKATS